VAYGLGVLLQVKVGEANRARSFIVCNKMENQSRYMVSDSEVMSGAPVFAGSRVPFAYLMEYLERGSTVENFSEDYPSVSVELATRALEAWTEDFRTRK